jgi:hypothetical protein
MRCLWHSSAKPPFPAPVGLTRRFLPNRLKVRQLSTSTARARTAFRIERDVEELRCGDRRTIDDHFQARRVGGHRHLRRCDALQALDAVDVRRRVVHRI